MNQFFVKRVGTKVLDQVERGEKMNMPKLTAQLSTASQSKPSFISLAASRARHMTHHSPSSFVLTFSPFPSKLLLNLLLLPKPHVAQSNCFPPLYLVLMCHIREPTHPLAAFFSLLSYFPVMIKLAHHLLFCFIFTSSF